MAYLRSATDPAVTLEVPLRLLVGARWGIVGEGDAVVRTVARCAVGILMAEGARSSPIPLLLLQRPPQHGASHRIGGVAVEVLLGTLHVVDALHRAVDQHMLRELLEG